jgi:hypothetical protein
MPPGANFQNLVQYTTLAATTAKSIGQTYEVPFLAGTATVALSILKLMEVNILAAEKYPCGGLTLWTENQVGQRTTYSDYGAYPESSLHYCAA